MPHKPQMYRKREDSNIDLRSNKNRRRVETHTTQAGLSGSPGLFFIKSVCLTKQTNKPNKQITVFSAGGLFQHPASHRRP